MLLGLDPEYDNTLKIAAGRMAKATEAMSAALKKAGALETTTYKPAEGEADVVEEARGVMRKLVKYAESRDNGEALAKEILHGSNLTTLSRKRPSKLIAAMDHALEVIEKRKADLNEYEYWKNAVAAARDVLDKRDKDVRNARVDRRDMTPEVKAARAEWLNQYGSAKLIVEGILKGIKKLDMMTEIFDDLADVQRVAGVVADKGADKTAGDDAPPADTTTGTGEGSA
jgi:hypothetical protein